MVVVGWSLCKLLGRVVELVGMGRVVVVGMGRVVVGLGWGR